MPHHAVARSLAEASSAPGIPLAVADVALNGWLSPGGVAAVIFALVGLVKAVKEAAPAIRSLLLAAHGIDAPIPTIEVTPAVDVVVHPEPTPRPKKPDGGSDAG